MNDTYFILAGGNDRQFEDYGKRLGEEIAKHVTNPKILSCFYSQPEETWEEKAEDWQGWFSNNFSRSFTYDYTKPEGFLGQIDAADVVYFHGGDTKLLLSKLPDTDILRRHFTGKIIIGSSAGSNMLSRHYWSSRRAEYSKGKSVLNLSIMVHYGASIVGDNERTQEEWKRQEKTFSKMINMPITRLPEGQFIVVKD